MWTALIKSGPLLDAALIQQPSEHGDAHDDEEEEYPEELKRWSMFHLQNIETLIKFTFRWIKWVEKGFG